MRSGFRPLHVAARCSLVVGLVVGAVIAPAPPANRRSAEAAALPAPIPITPITPTRVLDTREGLGAPAAALAPASTIDLQIAGVADVPATGAGAVVLSVTVTEPTAPSFITVWPTGEPRPLTSSLNMLPGDTVPNLVIAKLGDAGRVSISTSSDRCT
jgi:serine protease